MARARQSAVFEACPKDTTMFLITCADHLIAGRFVQGYLKFSFHTFVVWLLSTNDNH